jgi:hypothetical protein
LTLDRQQKKQQKAADQDSWKAAQELKVRLAAEGQATRETLRVEKQKKKAAAKALQIQKKNKAARAKTPPQSKLRYMPHVQARLPVLH